MNFFKTDFTAILVRSELSNLPAGGNTHGYRIEIKNGEDEKSLSGNRDG